MSGIFFILFYLEEYIRRFKKLFGKLINQKISIRKFQSENFSQKFFLTSQKISVRKIFWPVICSTSLNWVEYRNVFVWNVFVRLLDAESIDLRFFIHVKSLVVYRVRQTSDTSLNKTALEFFVSFGQNLYEALMKIV